MNNHTSFHLWWKKNLLNYQKVSNYYEHDWSCSNPINPNYDLFFFLKKKLSTWFICNSFMIKLQIISSKNSARYLFCSKKGYKTMTKCFIMKKKGNIFIKQLLSNCKATSTSDFHNDMSKCQGWGSILVPYKKV